MSVSENQGFNTRAVHAGQAFEPRTGAVVPPLHFSSTYAQDGIGGLREGYEYGRGGNPTRDALQEQLAAVEGGTAAFSFGSGLAAEDSLIRALTRPGDHIVLGNDAYGGTYRLINGVLMPVCLETTARLRFLGSSSLRMTYSYSEIDDQPVADSSL